MTGLLVVLGIIVLLVVIAAGFRRWKRYPRPARTVRGPTYRQMKEQDRHRIEKYGGPDVNF